MNILKLTIKKKYFDMIYYEEKKEEYREIKKNWIQQLVSNRFTRNDYKKESDVVNLIIDNMEHYNKRRIHDFDFVEFRNGYSKNSPKLTLECKKIEIGFGKEHLGAEPNKLYFVIKLGRIVKIENVIYKTKPHD